MKIQETHENSRKFMKNHDFHEANHSYHCDGPLTSVHGLTLFRDLATVFLGSNTFFRDAKSCSHRDGLFKARDPNAFALPRIVERSHFPAFIVYRTSSSCNLAFKLRVQVQICFSVYRSQGFMGRSVVYLATPCVKKKPMTKLT